MKPADDKAVDKKAPVLPPTEGVEADDHTRGTGARGDRRPFRRARNRAQTPSESEAAGRDREAGAS